MASKTMIGGTVHDIDGGKCMIGGTVYGIDYGNTMVSGTVRKIELKSNKPLGVLPIGSVVKVMVSGELSDFIVVQKGLPSSYYDTSCDGVWLMSKYVAYQEYWGNFQAEYNNSNLNSFLNRGYFSQLDTSFSSLIRNVKIPYYNAAYTNVYDMYTKIFSLSAREAGSSSFNTPIDGDPIEFFKTDSDESRIATDKTGTTSRWWLRTPSNRSRSYAFVTRTDGIISDSQSDKMRHEGVRPVFVLDATVMVDGNGRILT